jgi:hypothetical protein
LEPLKKVYWSRAGFGLLAAVLCGLFRLDQTENAFLTGISLALLLYIITYYVFKALFATKVEKKSKLVTNGIGIYFITWIFAWTLFSTLMHPVAVFSYSPELPTVGNTVTFDAAESYDLTSHIESYKWDFGDGGNTTVGVPTVTHVYTEVRNYTVRLTVEDGEGYAAEVLKIIEIPV